MMPELLEVLRFQREDLSEHAAGARSRGRWYGDYPFRDDRALRDPALGSTGSSTSCRCAARVDDLRWEGERLRIARLRVHRAAIGAPERGAQQLSLVVAAPPARAAARCAARSRRCGFKTRADAPARRDRQGRPAALATSTWSGFEATLDPRAPAHAPAAGADGDWDVYVHVRAGARAAPARALLARRRAADASASSCRERRRARSRPG